MAKPVQVHLNLIRDHVQDAAREARMKASREEWETLVAWALAVVCLEEAERTAVEYWAAPRSR